MSNMTDFDITELYKYYSKNIINERVDANIYLKENMTSEQLPVSPTGKFTPVLYYEEVQKPPFTFEVNFNFIVDFDINKIAEDYSEETVEDSEDIPVNIPDTEVEKMIYQKMTDLDTGKKEIKKRKFLDIDGFYFDVYRKNLSAAKMSGRINDLVRSGVIYIGEFKISFAIEYSAQMNDDLMKDKITKAYKLHKPTTGPIKSGYAIIFESSNKIKTYTEKDYVEFIDKFGEGFANSILKDTEYYKITA